MLFNFLMVVHAIVAALLVTIILMQRSEGGGLTTGGSPSGLMSARGASDFLTRSTAVLAAVFIGMSILLAVLAATRQSTAVDVNAARGVAPAPVGGPAAPPVAAGEAQFSGAAQSAVQAGNQTAPVDNGVPLAR